MKSKIISENDSIKIENWLIDSIGKVSNYELIYRATEHGDSLSVSLEKCKNIPNLNIPNNIYNCNSHTIEFGYNGNYEFCVGDKFLSSNSVTFTNNNIFNHNLELCNTSNVSLNELEVFKVVQ